MKRLNIKFARDGGWTFVEALLSVVVMSIMILGLTVVLMAFHEQLDRSWSIRVMDQYGNDVIEQLTHTLRNAVDVSVRAGTGNTDRIDVKFLDPFYHDLIHTQAWRVDNRTGRVTVDNRPLVDFFPPTKMKRGENYEIVKFTLSPYGFDTPNVRERQDRFNRNDNFVNATYDIRLILRYNKKSTSPGQANWSFEKEYYNRVYMRNKNLIIKDGISQ